MNDSGVAPFEVPEKKKKKCSSDLEYILINSWFGSEKRGKGMVSLPIPRMF